MRLYELKQKEVINTRTCRSLGCPSDIDFCAETCQIRALIVPCSNHIFSFWEPKNMYIIPWNCICKIGEDIILVDIIEADCLLRESANENF